MNILATLTENQMCVLVFAGSIFVMFACAWLLPFNDNWPDGKA
jgi:low affinity Fe/Cu permease